MQFDEDGNLITFGGQPMLLDYKIAQDSDVLSLLDKYRPGMVNLEQSLLGQSKVFLNGTCKCSECNLGNLVTDAMVYTNAIVYNGAGWTDASIAFFNGGGLRSSCSIGNITLNDLITAIPLSDTIITIDVVGSDLRAALEHSVSRFYIL